MMTGMFLKVFNQKCFWWYWQCH